MITGSNVQAEATLVVDPTKADKLPTPTHCVPTIESSCDPLYVKARVLQKRSSQLHTPSIHSRCGITNSRHATYMFHFTPAYHHFVSFPVSSRGVLNIKEFQG